MTPTLFLCAVLSLGQTEAAPTSKVTLYQANLPTVEASADQLAAAPADKAADKPAAAPAEPAKPIEITAPLLPAPTPPAAPAAAAAPGAASPPYRWLLMRELQGTAPGTIMDTERLSVYGWDQGSFTASTADDTNSPMSWNDRANQFLLQQAWFRIDRSVVTTGTTEPTYGGRIDMIYGSDYRYTLPQRGLLFSQRFENQGFFDLYGFDPVQFYGEAYYPTFCRGLDVKVGRFYTPYGVESIEAVSTPLISHSYTFSNGSPFTHTGVLSTATLTPVWTVQAGLVVGSDLFISEADNPTFVGSVQWTQPATIPNTGRNIVKFTTILGKGKFDINPAPGVNNINIFDLTWTHYLWVRPNSYSTLHPEWAMPIPVSGLSYQLETLYGYQANAPIGTPAAEDPRNGFTNWLSLVQYLNYQFTPRLAGVARLELFEDFQGSRTAPFYHGPTPTNNGFPGLYIAPTLGTTFKLRPEVILRQEIRYDYNDETRAFDGHHGLGTAAVDMIVRW